MDYSLRDLGERIQNARKARGLSQLQLASSIAPATNRSAIAHIEQGRRLGDIATLRRICEFLSLPPEVWSDFINDPRLQTRVQFESALSELVGRSVSLQLHDTFTETVADAAIAKLFQESPTDDQALDAINSLFVYYGVAPMAVDFFKRYFSNDATKSAHSLMAAVERYQADAIRLFPTFGEAYLEMNAAGSLSLHLSHLAPKDLNVFRRRRPWDLIERIPPERLPDLGYISAARARQEVTERQGLADFLNELAEKVGTGGRNAIVEYPERKRRRMSSLLRKFESRFEHDLMSPLFTPDADAIRREAIALGPKESGDLDRVEATQGQAQRNLARYLAADYLDVYIATSMRSDADFRSVSDFTDALFLHSELRPLKLRYFDPTQSWIDDRVAKGLVEALMLRRSALTIYMAQKVDTFGKDSEASVALGQGKPVVVYVPRLYLEGSDIDSAAMATKPRAELESLVAEEGDGDDHDADPTIDAQALLARLLMLRIRRLSAAQFVSLTSSHWADFDLYAEDQRIPDHSEREAYRVWLDSVQAGSAVTSINSTVRANVENALVAVAVRFEGRARLFKEQHPLALQVIVSTKVLNGMLVARSIDSCAHLVAACLRNEHRVQLSDDDQNYRLVEQTTQSVMRVISRHPLIVSAFAAFYAPD